MNFDFRRNDYLSLDGHMHNKINENTYFMLVQVALSDIILVCTDSTVNIQISSQLAPYYS